MISSLRAPLSARADPSRNAALCPASPSFFVRSPRRILSVTRPGGLSPFPLRRRLTQEAG
jgi:hypothetical protein